MEEGGGLRLCLSEIAMLDGAIEDDLRIANARSSYLELVVKPPLIKMRPAQQAKLDEARGTYVDSIIRKINNLLDANSPEDALALRQMPSIIRGTSFTDETKLTAENLAANHLYSLIDTALCEHIARRKLIDEARNNQRVNRLLGNRAVRMALAAGVFISSISPTLHFIPLKTSYAHDVQLTLEIASASVFGIEAPEEFRWRYLDIKNAKRTKKLHDKLASSRNLSDLALRMTYSATRYGGSSKEEVVTGRAGTDNKEENLKRFNRLDEEFKHMNNDPGGKPYSGNQALGYAARFLIERSEQVSEILEESKTAKDRRQLFIKLAEEIISEDIKRMEEGLGSTKLRQKLILVLGTLTAFAFPSILAAAGHGSSLGTEITHVGSKDKHFLEEESNTA